MIACWSAKGGSGTTTVAVALAVLAARESAGGVLLVDLGGDAPAVLGLTDPPGPGLLDWLEAGDDVPADALHRLEVDAGSGLRLLPRGGGVEPGTGARVPRRRAGLLVGRWRAGPRVVVVDCGVIPGGPLAGGAVDGGPIDGAVDGGPVDGGGPDGEGLDGSDRGGAGVLAVAVAGAGAPSLAVLRPCYLALRRALLAPVRPTGVVVTAEDGRSLGPADVADVLGVPVVAEVPADPAVARAVDAGLLARRVPRSLARALGRLVGEAVGEGAAARAPGGGGGHR